MKTFASRRHETNPTKSGDSTDEALHRFFEQVTAAAESPGRLAENVLNTPANFLRSSPAFHWYRIIGGHSI